MDTTTTCWNTSNSHTYHIYHTLFHHDYNIFVDETQLLHVDNSTFTPKKPDLTFHAGADNNAPVVSVCKFQHFSRHMKIGLGDPKYPNDVAWEDLKSKSVMSLKYRMEVTVNGARKSFIWKRSMFGEDLRLSDEETNDEVARFNSTFFSFTKSGRLEVQRSYGPGFDLMVLTTALGLAEKHRREESNAAGAAGGGG